MSLVILDWGVGGFGTYVLLRERCPKLDILYIADGASPPYGTVEPAALGARLEVLAAASRATEFVIACNAASAAVTPDLALPERTEGVITHGVALLADRAPLTVGVIGGRGTIANGSHERALTALGHTVVARHAQPLSAHVEAGRLAGPELDADMAEILLPMREVDALLLGCTHYPAIPADAYRAHTPKAEILDPAAHLVDDIIARWGLADRDGTGRFEVRTSGDTEALRAGAKASFGVDIVETAITQWQP